MLAAPVAACLGSLASAQEPPPGEGPSGGVAPAAEPEPAPDGSAPDGSAPDGSEPAAPASDAEVVVLAERIRRAPGSVHVIGAETLERYKYDDPHATLQLVPGVYVRQEDGFGLRPNIGIRGAISDRSSKVALMEDGVLFGPAPYSAPAAERE